MKESVYSSLSLSLTGVWKNKNGTNASSINSISQILSKNPDFAESVEKEISK